MCVLMFTLVKYFNSQKENLIKRKRIYLFFNKRKMFTHSIFNIKH